MAAGLIGYYVHHHGQGHLTRMCSVAAALTPPVTGWSSLARPDGRCHIADWLDLPLDDDPVAGRPAAGIDPTASGTLHWAPRHHPGLRRRMALIAAWIDEHDPDVAVVDVSVEVALLCKLLGVPVAVVGMRGDRTDRAHRFAYDAADLLLAPWPAAFPASWPAAWLAKTVHTGAISRFDGEAAPAVRPIADRPRVLVLWGGDGDVAARVGEAEGGAAGFCWRLPAAGENVWSLLDWADVVVTHAGQNAVAEVAAAGRPAVVVADVRPHGEQAATADVLGRAGLAVAVRGWPAGSSWPGLLERALQLGGARWPEWNDHRGARRAAAAIESFTDRTHPVRTMPAR